MNDAPTRLRFVLFRLLAIAAFVVIGVRLWELQIVSSDEYLRSADANRFRLLPTDAPRGIIYDRYGRMLVRNVASFAVSVVPGGLPQDAAERLRVLSRVGELLQMEVGERPQAADSVADVDSTCIEGILALRYNGPYNPVRIASDVDRQAALILEEEHPELPGVLVETEPIRHYLEGALTAHILGYVGQIPASQLEGYLADSEQAYQADDMVGLTGVEYTQERVLRGVPGQKHIEVDVYQREVAVLASSEPEAGQNIILTLDVELQRFVEEALSKGMRAAGSEVGVAIAMDPRTGEVLSMVTLPSFDNNLFSGGISYSDYERLNSDPNHPLLNHAIGGQYPPGSTFKLVSATAVLEDHIVDRSTLLACGGTMWLPNKYAPDNRALDQPFYCWHRGGHGALNIVGALLQSCDIYFYQAVGGFKDLVGLSYTRLAEYASEFGFGQRTGIELTGEATGLIPDDRWKRQNYGENWVTGDTYNAAIGQGYILATPLQVVSMCATVANGGTVLRPQVVYQVTDAQGQVLQGYMPVISRQLDTAAEDLALVRRGMREAVQFGTAWGAQIPNLAVAGKTGSAEFASWDEEGNLIVDEFGYMPTHAWFTCFAPYEDPEIALVIFLEGGGEGSQTAVPVAAEILKHYFGLDGTSGQPVTVTTP